MDPIDHSFNDLFHFDPFDNNGQDISLVADQHLFDNGRDLFATNPLGLNGESTALPRVGPSIHQHPTSGEYTGHPISDLRFHDNNLDLLTHENLDTGPADLTPLVGPLPEFMAQQYHGLGLTFDSSLQFNPNLPPLTVEPALVFDQTRSFPHVVLSTAEEKQQWQAFKNQYPVFFQPEPQVSQTQPFQAVQQWEPVENEHGLVLRSPLEPRVNNPTPVGSQTFPELELPQNVQQAAIAQPEDILSDEQVHLLQNVESEQNILPSVEIAPTNTSISRDGADSENSLRSRNAPNPEQTTRLAFASLEDAEAAMASRYIENDWKSPNPDTTAPNTQKKRSKYVLEMFSAFQDTSKCKDNQNGYSFGKRWQNGEYYNLESMEKVCWRMLDIAERLHEFGPSSTVMYCEEALKKVKASRLLTFEQRIHAICAMLKFSKHLCDQLMKGEGLEALVGAPKQKMSGATTMHVQNKRRQGWIVHGRTGRSTHGKDENEGVGPNGRTEQSDEVEHDGAADVQPTQRNQQSKAQRATPAKTRSTTISREDSSREAESAHRRQSNAGISRVEDESVVASPIAASGSLWPPLPVPRPSFASSALSIANPSPVSSRTTPKSTPPKHVSSSQVHVPPTETDDGRAWVEKQRELAKLDKERAAGHPATVAAAKKQQEASGAKNEATKSNTQIGPRKRPAEEPVHDAKRQRTHQDLFAEWLAHNDGSNADDLREAGYGDGDSVHHSDAAVSDHNNDVGGDEENEDEIGSAASSSCSPSPIRERKMENATTMGEIQMVRPLVMTAKCATKPVPNFNKRKVQHDSESEESLGSEDDGVPLTKRAKRSGGSTR